jgi:hypothetical protein
MLIVDLKLGQQKNRNYAVCNIEALLSSGEGKRMRAYEPQ